MTLRLPGSTSGYTEIDGPVVGSNNTLILPSGNGSNGQILGTDGAGNLSWVNGRMALATAQNTTSGTAIDFTGIPSWVKRVTVMFNGVSTNGSSQILIQIGTSGGFETTGYLGSASNLSTGITSGSSSSGFLIANTITSPSTFHGLANICAFGSTTWVYNATLGSSDTARTLVSGGQKILSGTLDRIRLTTVNGTDTFDAGSVNILYEG